MTPKDECQARSGLYGLFSRLLLAEPDEPLLALLREEPWHQQLERLGTGWERGEFPDSEELAVEYCRIFIGPKNFCPPYQSVWVDGQMQSPVVDSMKEFLEYITPRSNTPVVDHAGLQFEMMALILESQAQEPESVTSLAELFFQNHVAWSARMLRRATELSSSRFYRSLLDSAREFVESEVEFYRELAQNNPSCNRAES